MKIIRSFDEWCNEALKLLKNSEYCYISSFNLNYTEELNNRVFNILQEAIKINHKILIGISTLQCTNNCEHCIINNKIKYNNVNKLKNITNNYRIVQELHTKAFITSNGYIIGGMNITGSGWIDRSFSHKFNNPIELKNDFDIMYNEAKSYNITEFIDPKIIFTFGKYKGQKIEDIKKVNPNYIEWLSKNTIHKL